MLLVFSLDACVTTVAFQPAATVECPDICPGYGPEYDGNVEDPSHSFQYVACWKGTTVGCISCPSGLQFNEAMNACLYDGKHVKLPSLGDASKKDAEEKEEKAEEKDQAQTYE